jgi:hypothetical protein
MRATIAKRTAPRGIELRAFYVVSLGGDERGARSEGAAGRVAARVA